MMHSIPMASRISTSIERQNSAIVGLNSRLDAGYDERDGVQTGFAPGSVLVELTGNADDAIVDPTNSIPNSIRVSGSGQINMRIPRNDTHGKGYVIYGLAGPQGSLSLTNVASVLAGATPTAANNGTARLANIDVITANSFSRPPRHDARHAAGALRRGQPRPRCRRRRRHRHDQARRRFGRQQQSGRRRHESRPTWLMDSNSSPALAPPAISTTAAASTLALAPATTSKASIRPSSPKAAISSRSAPSVTAQAAPPSSPISSKRFTSTGSRRRRRSSASIHSPAHPAIRTTAI